jgi:4-alpha-glucanotransferase
MMASFPRASGVLMHPTSFPGPYGIGDLGQAAYDFVDKLVEAGQTYWQVLPLGPTAFGDSPYQCLSSFAGNTNLISLDKLLVHGWLKEYELDDKPAFRARIVEYEKVIGWHEEMLTRAYERFLVDPTSHENQAFQAWCSDPAVNGWLGHFALFAALKEKNNLAAWVYWPTQEALSVEAALAEARWRNRYRIEEHKFRQWLFFSQWNALKGYANERGIRSSAICPST